MTSLLAALEGSAEAQACVPLAVRKAVKTAALQLLSRVSKS